MSEKLETMMKDSLRITHNNAIDAAVKMILICEDQPLAHIIAAVQSLRVEEPLDVNSRSARPPTGEAT